MFRNGGIVLGGTRMLVNNGTIAADVAGGTILLTESAVTNNAVVRAAAGATLVADSAFTNAVNGLVRRRATRRDGSRLGRGAAARRRIPVRGGPVGLHAARRRAPRTGPADRAVD